MTLHIVLGGAGFLGSHLVDALNHPEDRVIVLDDFSSGRPENLRSSPDVKVIAEDVRSPGAFLKLLDETGGPASPASVAVVWNLASPASPPRYKADPIRCMETSAGGARLSVWLARHFNRTGVLCRIVHASTSEVYGDPELHPQPEAYVGHVHPQGPRCMYDEGKRYAEAYLWSAATHEHLDVRIARIFNCYGPRMDPRDGRVITTFIRQLLDGENLTVHGDGTQTRSFCYVDDLIGGLVDLGRMPIQAHDAPPLTVNLGNDEEVSICRVACSLVRIAALMGAIETDRRVAWLHYALKERISYIQQPCEHDPRRRCPDLKAAKGLLGYHPSIGLEEGLRMTIRAALEDRS